MYNRYIPNGASYRRVEVPDPPEETFRRPSAAVEPPDSSRRADWPAEWWHDIRTGRWDSGDVLLILILLLILLDTAF